VGSIAPLEPVLNPTPSPDTDGTYPISWNLVSDAALYQLQESTDSAFGTVSDEFWPTNSYDEITDRQGGTYYYRVKAWSSTPETGGVSSDWSDTITVTVGISAPVASANMASILPGGQFVFSWDSIEGAVIYEVDGRIQDFPGLPNPPVWNRTSWPTGISETITIDSGSAQYYFRVRAWTDLPENDGTASEWSNIVTVTVNNQTVQMIDNFDDADDNNLIGGTNGSWGSAVTRSFEDGSLKLDYNMALAGWSAYSFLIDYDQRNISSYENLTFFIKGTADEYGIAMKDRFGNEIKLSVNDYIEGGAVVDTYGKVTVPLSAFTGVNKSEVTYIWLDFDANNLQYNTGAINIEDLALE
jgi:hypothetical protein